ncbi:MAG: 1-acyl-sn-glycerol-3-phosphate acyltransferase [Sphingopyxis sp.]|nr:1-acyl-sn-glycerol-3-phosphate acyltransferase [Sphingopyxis sp.]
MSPSAVRIDRRPFGRNISLLGWLRIAFRLFGLIILLLALLPVHFVTLLAGRVSPWPSRFLGGAAWIVGADVRITGVPAQRELLFVANHVSAIDILAMGGATGTAFVAKAELERAPLLGWLADMNKTVYVARQDRLAIAEQIGRVRDAMATCHRLTVFPEGTTSDGHTLLPFKSALLAVLDPPPERLMVQPVWIDYGADTADIAWVGAESGIDYGLRILARPLRFALTLHFLEPFAPQDFPGRKAMAAEAQARIREAMARR